MALVKTASPEKVMPAPLIFPSFAASDCLESANYLPFLSPPSYHWIFIFPPIEIFFFPGEKQKLRCFHPPSHFNFLRNEMGILGAQRLSSTLLQHPLSSWMTQASEEGPGGCHLNGPLERQLDP